MTAMEYSLIREIEDALKDLLSEKHLYQFVNLNSSILETASDAADVVEPSIGNLFGKKPEREWEKELYHKSFSLPWLLDSQARNDQRGSRIVFTPPQIMTYCDECGQRWPFANNGAQSYASLEKRHTQSFLFVYDCQRCTNSSVTFLVRREHFKLTLCGRDPIEAVPAPKALPKTVSKFFSTATIARNAGQTLAGIFLLRVTIEQHWRSVLPDLSKQRATGDELGEAYKAGLPLAFKELHPTLLGTYSNLSKAIHSASDDSTVFDESHSEIIEHFEALPHFLKAASRKNPG